MADLKVTQLTSLAAVPAAGDLLMVVDVSDTTMSAAGTNKQVTANYVGRTSGAVLYAQDDKAATLPASGTVAMLEQAQTFTGMPYFSAAARADGFFSEYISGINDDAAYSFTPETARGVIFIFNISTLGTTARRETYALIAYDTGTPYTVILTQPASRIEVTTGALTGTTGTDTKFTVSAHTDGKIYLENRTGGAIGIGTFLLTPKS